MKIIFLDVDGVLNTPATTSIYEEFAGWEKSCVELVNYIIRKTGAAVVVFSFWRFNLSMNEMIRIFTIEMGIHGIILGSTPILELRERGAEIDAWMKLYKKKTSQDIEHFVIVDDIDPILFQEHWIETDYRVGLTPKVAEKPIGRLNGDQVKIPGSRLLDTVEPCEDLFMSVASQEAEDMPILDYQFPGNNEY